MTDHLRITLAQLNPLMGDIAGNLALARRARALAAKQEADLILFSELFITGYPPEDLVLKPALQEDAREAIQKLAADTTDGGPAMLIGTPWMEDGKLHNAFVFLDGGRIAGRTFKVDLPNYGVFDEKRVFVPGPMPKPFDIRGVRIGVPVCEDIWTPDVVACLKKAGAEILLVPNGSPYEAGKETTRLDLVSKRIIESGLPIVYLNQLGGQDEIVFDGASFVSNGDGHIQWLFPAWEERVLATEWSREEGGWTCAQGSMWMLEGRDTSVYSAMVLGLRDYVNKNRFPGVVLGMSGGIDSALSAIVAADALGADRVRCVMMPSRYTSKDSLDHAAECARRIGCSYETIPIESAVEAFGASLRDTFKGKNPDTTEENIQSRVRGVILMAISNKFGPMVLTTGNKSEMSVGYATLYGDMCGGYNVLKDVYKTEVFRLAKWRNFTVPRGSLCNARHVIPPIVLAKPPSAELRENQKDQDSLPPYDILDGILECLVENEMTFEATCAKGYHPATVKRIEQLLYVSEYKRRQAPPGVKVTAKNFGRDRRYPITNAFRDARDL